VETVTVPSSRGSIREPSSLTLEIAGDIENAPGTILTAVKRFNYIDRAAVQVTAFKGDLK
jgi:hypothetical protein